MATTVVIVERTTLEMLSRSNGEISRNALSAVVDTTPMEALRRVQEAGYAHAFLKDGTCLLVGVGQADEMNDTVFSYIADVAAGVAV